MITFSIGVFFWLSIFYLFLKNKFKFKPFADLGFLCIVVFFMCSINMTTMRECNTPEMAILYTILPWMLMFAPMLVALYYMPSWKAPFSNTIGYFFVSFKKENVNTLIQLLKDQTEDCKARILASPWILLNQFTSTDFDTVKTSTLKGGGITNVVHSEMPEATVVEAVVATAIYDAEPVFISKNIYLDWLHVEDTEKMQKLKEIIQMKELIATWIWYMLIALITISTSYTLIMNQSCAKKIKNPVQSKK